MRNAICRPSLSCMTVFRRVGLGLAASALSLCAAHADQAKPNILLIVVDDMGMADLGSFGGEIPTPNLDQLAEDGVRLTNFHTAPVCSPTRAMLLTGVDSHIAGLGNMAEELAPNQQNKPGYEGYLNDRVVTVASLLQDAGYHTYMAGKWHLGTAEGYTPDDRGFEHSFAMLSGGAGHFSDMQPAYHPDLEGAAPYMQDGKMLASLPDNFEYSTQFYADQMIEYIQEGADDGKPFFAYLAYTAPHWPLQAPDKTIAKYKDAYDSGYDQLHADRLARQKELGIIPDNATGNERPPNGTPWVDLTDEQKQTEARAMEIYAAMIDEIDHHTGRLLDALDAQGELDDTLIIFMSDNGAEGHSYDETWPADKFPEIRRNIDTRHDFSYENMGHRNSYVLYGPNWARAGSPAYRLHKGFPTEGGTRVAAFMNYKQMRRGEISDQFFTVKDITPTILEFANIDQPQTYNGHEIALISGKSMATFLEGGAVSHEGNIEAGEIFGKAFVRDGDWKLTLMPEPYGKGEWQLYNLKTDLAETKDLITEQPEIAEKLKGEWQKYKKDNNVILPDWVSGY